MAAETKLTRREAAEDEIVLGLLGAVERDPGVTQRIVANQLGIALGLANAYLKRCVTKGLIKVTQAPARRYAYYLTPQGFAEKSRLTANYLTHSFSFFRKARMQCKEIYATATARGYKRCALIGQGDLAEIAALVAGEHPIALAGTVPASADARRISAAVEGLGGADCVLVTAFETPNEVYAAACKALGAERVFAPALLRAHAALAGKAEVREATDE